MNRAPHTWITLVWTDSTERGKEVFWAPNNHENDTDKGYDCVELVEKRDRAHRWDDQHCYKKI
jgi:hypothetical protein